MNRCVLSLLIASLAIFGCATTSPKKTQLQTREFQTRTFDVNDTKMIMKAMLNVFQDEGFILKSAEVELGFLTATKEVDIETWGRKVFGKIIGADWGKHMTIEATANVSELGAQSRVRLNFQKKVIDNKGEVMEIEQIEDAEFYQDFFSKVDKAIFLQKEKVF